MADFDEILEKAGDYVSNLGANIIHQGTLGLLGIEPLNEEVRQWQAENPKVNLATSLAAQIPLYVAGGAAVKGSTYGTKVLNSIKASEKLAKAPVASKALELMALEAPIEIGRQALGFGVQETFDLEGGSAIDRALESGLNLGFTGALGAAGGFLLSAGKRAKTSAKLKELNPKDPWQWQLRKLNEMIQTEADPVVRRDLESTALMLNKGIRGETRDTLVSRLETVPENSKALSINSVMKGTGGFSSKMLQLTNDAMDTSRFRSSKELTEVLNAGDEAFGANWLEYTQFPRWVQGNAKAQKKVLSNLDRTGGFAGMEYVGDGWFLGREQDGMYVMARSLKPKGAKSGMMFFKTDKPQRFLPGKFEAKELVDRNIFADPRSVYKEIPNMPGAIYNRTLKMNKIFSESATEQTLDPKAASIWDLSDQGISKLAERLTGDKNIIKDSEAWNRIKDFARRYTFPSVFKFKPSLEARKIFAVARDAMDSGMLRAAEWVFGKPGVDLGGSTLKWLTRGISRNDPGAFATKAKAWAKQNPEGEKVLLKILNNRITDDAISEADRLILGNEGLQLLDQMSLIDNGVFTEMMASADAMHLGEKAKYILKQGHRGISHYFEGSLRQAVLDERGNLVYLASGNAKGAVMEKAQGVIEEAKKLGREFHLGEYWSKDRTLDMKHLKMINPEDSQVGDLLAERFYEGKVRSASFQMSSADIEGFQTMRSIDDVVESLHTSIESKYRWLAQEIIDNVLAKDIQALGLTDPQMALALQDTLQTILGQSGEFSTLVNKTVDTILSPVLGVNSASKIAHTLNTGIARLDLGFWNMSYFLANILQPIQTLTPQLSMLMRCPEALQWAYDTVPICGKRYGGLVSVFSPLKWLSKGMKLMANPKAEDGLEEFLVQMVREGTLTSKALESYIGESSEYGLNLVKAFREGSYVNGLKNICNWTANYSEQVSRAYALTVGYAFGNGLNKARMAEGFEGWTKDQLYHFARKFCDNTMFQFASADRARILQGPVGTAWGLFKNWGMHWIGWQMQYLDAGLKQGVWAPFMLSNVMTSLLGGIGASEMGAIAEKFYEWASDEKMASALYNEWNQNPLTNFALYGIPGAFGFSLKNQVTSSFVDPGEEAMRMLSVASFSRLKALWNALGAGMDYYVSTGDRNFAKDRNFQQQMLRALAPKNLYRQLQVVDGQIRTMGTKNLIIEASPTASFFYKWFNVPSVDIDLAFQASTEIWKSKTKRNEATAAAANVLADALESGDSRVISQVLAQIGAQGLALDSVIESAAKRLSNRNLPLLVREKNNSMEWLGALTV